MIDNLLTLTYSVDGVEPAADNVYKRDSYEKNRSYFYNVADRLSGTPARNDVTLVITPPKATATFFGTARTESSFGQGFEVNTPIGVLSVREGTMKVFTSIPSGVSLAHKTEFLNRFRAWIASQDFTDLVLEGEY